MSESIGVAILAAGEGKRMGKKMPKPLVPVLGKSLIDYILSASEMFCYNSHLKSLFGVVVGHQREMVEEHVKAKFSQLKNIQFPVQEKQLGTADALKSYFEGTNGSKETDYTMVLCADTPLLTEFELEDLWKKMKSKNYDAVAAVFTVPNPYGYGRIARGTKGFQIIEEKDATNEQRSICEVNSGLYIFKTKYILDTLAGIDCKNQSGEFYLTDAFAKEANVHAVSFENADAFLGVNNVIQLESSNKKLRARVNHFHQSNGVEIIDSNTTYIEADIEIGVGTIIYPGTYLMGSSKIGENCIIEPGVILKDSKVQSEVNLKAYSYLEEAEVAKKCSIGPYARLRPKAKLNENCKIGNFVEIKKSNLDKSVSISHLSYVGDAEIGENVNIGCGFITCNYDGEGKHKTIIGKNSFIGSDSQMIAPVTIGESAFVASGSTINQDVPNEGFAVARGRQITKEKMAGRFLKGKWAIKK